ncbi:hypothetical protein GDO81_027262 [Engystomops pustulosus]|uniref:Uncharacterized protein n=1 Tax=Engystomops pustulosus TaxID=76066 RepID=A0AAV6YK46_ENGPU|nr:hypothetical protein GDO81_027262 [Engystomops pustulosus]
MEGADVPDEEQEEEALLSGSVCTVPETPDIRGAAPDHPGTGNTEGDMEVVEQPVEQPVPVPSPASAPTPTTGNNYNVVKKRKKDKSTRKPKSAWTTVQKPSKMRVESQADVTVTTNRYSVLSESDEDEELERELKRMMEEYDDDPGGDPPTKRRPLHAESQSVWDMEAGSQEDNSDSDL